MGRMMQTLCQVSVGPCLDNHARAQHDLRELALARTIDHRAFSMVEVIQHCDAGVGAEVQVPKLVTCRYGGDE